MPVVRASELRLGADGLGVDVSARVDGSRLGWRRQRLWFRLPPATGLSEPQGDAFVVALLLPAMAAGADLEIDAPLSTALVESLAHIQELLVGWNAHNPWTRLHRIRVSGDGNSVTPPGPDRTGLFFTGGVDSMYSLRHARRHVDHDVDTLLFVEGFDVPLDAPALAASVRRRLMAVSDAAARQLVTVRTNLRQLTDQVLSWEMMHGAALAAVGHLLSHTVQRWIVSSADAYLSNEAYGTAAELDPLWSRPGLQFLTVGLGLDRISKLGALAGDHLAQDYLTICWQRRGTAENCGRCAKCVRTALQLQVLDALPRFKTLPTTITPAHIAAILAEPVHRTFIWEDLAKRLASRPDGRPLADAVGQLLARSRRATHGPGLSDLVTREGRRLAQEWMRRQLQPRLPVAIRQRLWRLRELGR